MRTVEKLDIFFYVQSGALRSGGCETGAQRACDAVYAAAQLIRPEKTRVETEFEF